MKEVLIDINIIIEYLRTGKGLLPKVYDEYKMKIAASTFTELLASETFKDEQLEKEVIEFADKYFDVVDIDHDLAKEAARIIRENETTMAVAFIAAVARSKELPLVTDEPKVFEGIEGVEVMEFED